MNNTKIISADLELYFGNLRVQNKQFLPISTTYTKPFFYYDFQPDKYYTFVIVDPDAPVGYWIHYCVYNITDGSRGVEYYIYNPPSPPKNTGPRKDGRHRYYCILYVQSGKITGKKPIKGRDFKEYNYFKDLLGVVLEPVEYVSFVCKSGVM